ncbi:MAG: short-chain fatty acyl-CoA regulator family protein [Aquamicrobium sp.]|uniref:helix-turn-helix domain-containing protein n=1 Tax=Aquamicrobium sp. TaxID=1872579 RepID=UPI00349E9845|nr:short-chain fatty acyl-CoA regulator family protein [Aquamicrobium sp.]
MAIRTPIGARIRRKRKAIGLTQTALANALGISASYLNLIENNKRAIGGALLLRIGERLDIDLAHLSGENELRTIGTIGELMVDPVMRGIEMEAESIRDLATRFPEAAAALTRLYRAYSDASANIETLRHRLRSDPYLSQLLHETLNRVAGIKSGAEILATIPDLTSAQRDRFVSTINSEINDLVPTIRNLVDYFDQTTTDERLISPMNEVDDAIIDHNNHFPVLEELAEALAAELPARRPVQEEALAALLSRRFGIGFRLTSGAEQNPTDAAEGNVLAIPDVTPPSTRIFAMLRTYAMRAASPVIEEVVASIALTSGEARRLAFRSLSSYVAGAMMMPYETILSLAEERRYDIELIGTLVGASFEQVAHRLVTLRRTGREGVPFGFLRADRAGRMTKRFPLPGLILPASGHGCLLWPIYSAFAERGVVRQVSVFPGGARFLQVAKQVVKHSNGFNRLPPTFSVMLSCDMLHADRIVYGRDLTAGEAAVEIGPSCMLCPRMSCIHRHEMPTGFDRGDGIAYGGAAVSPAAGR